MAVSGSPCTQGLALFLNQYMYQVQVLQVHVPVEGMLSVCGARN